MTTPEHETGQSTSELMETIGKWVLKGGVALSVFRQDVLADLDRRLETISDTVSTAGFDPFGMDPETVKRAAVGAAFLYKFYFRCETHGLENLPSGPVILAANHAGQLPIDAVMITTGIMLESEPPRLARAMAVHWVPSIPFVSTYFSRMGVAVGTPENAERLLRRNEILLTFPEGVAGITKTVDEAYCLKDFSLGFLRLALAAKVPIVPVAVIGSEEQYPTLYSFKGLGKMVGLPTIPIWAQMVVPFLGLLPLPVKYRLNFGKPINLEGDPDDRDSVIQTMADTVQSELQQMVDDLRSKRRSIFR
jgi:1-acyl-sn-glycerol-3-phosphate acyltransferase